MALVPLLLALTGCATAVPAPTGPMWAFFTDGDPRLGPRAIVYTPSEIACENMRRSRLGDAGACVPVVVSPGDGYYAVALPSQFDASLPGGAIGTIDRERCERVRGDLFRAYAAMGDCEGIDVRRRP
jgi:hypothetical protein